MTDTQTKEAPAKTEKPKTLAGFGLDQKISFGVDKDGKKYDGGANNPKRAGSKGAERFSRYKEGMTIQQASDAGITAADLGWDTKKGFIKVA